MLRRRLLFAFSISLLPVLVLGQNVPTLRTQTSVVFVPTLVTTTEADLSLTLTAADFVLTDDGVPQTVSLESSSGRPLAILVLMQTGGAAPREFSYYRHLETMLDNLAGAAKPDFGLLTFDSQPEGIVHWSKQVAELHRAIASPEVGDHGAAILDAIYFSIDLFDSLPANPRRVIVLLSQPQDRTSKVSPAELLRKVSETNTEIYSLTFSPEKTAFKDALRNPGPENRPYPMWPGGVVANHTFNFDRGLRMIARALEKDSAAEIASISGGEAFQFDDQKELEQHLAELANHLPNRYMLSFRPTSHEPGLHTLNVRIPAHPALNINARSAYWVAPPELP